MPNGAPSQAPEIEPEMSRELGVVRHHTNYFLVEDLDWRNRNFHYGETNRRYTIHTSPRQFKEREVTLSKREVEGFPVVFEVREQGAIFANSTQVHFGIFPPDLPDEPVWPLESLLLQWTQTMYHKLMTAMSVVKFVLQGTRRFVRRGQSADERR